jgi:hypothetical protein
MAAQAQPEWAILCQAFGPGLPKIDRICYQAWPESAVGPRFCSPSLPIGPKNVARAWDFRARPGLSGRASHAQTCSQGRWRGIYSLRGERAVGRGNPAPSRRKAGGDGPAGAQTGIPVPHRAPGAQPGRTVWEPGGWCIPEHITGPPDITPSHNRNPIQRGIPVMNRRLHRVARRRARLRRVSTGASAHSPAPPDGNQGAGFLHPMSLYPYELCRSVLGFLGGRMWKNKVGHLPTELIEFTPLNSAVFLLLQNGKRRRKRNYRLFKQMGGSLNSFHQSRRSKTCK